jgi:hypothetical protein
MTSVMTFRYISYIDTILHIYQSVGVYTSQSSSEGSQDRGLKLGNLRMRARRMTSRWSSSVHVERNWVMRCLYLAIPCLFAVC